MRSSHAQKKRVGGDQVVWAFSRAYVHMSYSREHGLIFIDCGASAMHAHIPQPFFGMVRLARSCCRKDYVAEPFRWCGSVPLVAQRQRTRNRRERTWRETQLIRRGKYGSWPSQKGDRHHSAGLRRGAPCGKYGDPAMLNYDDLVELARMCARNAHGTTSKDVADELWQMAKEYQAQAAKLGTLPEIGDAPAVWKPPR
jgi:hypothetical protein